MRVIELPAGASALRWGQAHGEHFRDEIRQAAQVRVELCMAYSGFESSQALLELARRHMPVLEAFDRDLYDEVMGIAQGAGVDVGQVVVLNHYTDLRDLSPGDGPGEDDCTAVVSRTHEGMLLAQTWDMHGSALPYVAMVHVPEGELAPEAWLLSIAGCVGMTGMNAHGVGVTINNLNSTDAKVGVLWPALVRRLLRESDAKSAFDLLMQAPIGSGHHYIVADAEQIFAVETSGHHRKVTFSGPEGTYVHTNHCLDEAVAACTTVPDTSTTYDRLEMARRSIESRPIEGVADMWSRLASHEGYPRSICTHLSSPEDPHGPETCGGLVMNLSGGFLWAAPGCMVDNPHTTFTFGRGPCRRGPLNG